MALDLDGTNDKIEHGDIAALDNLGAFTVMAHYFFDVTTYSDGTFLSTKSATVATDVYTFGCGGVVAAGDVFASIGGGYGHTAGSQLSTGVWTHMALVFDGSLSGDANRLKIYKDLSQLTISSFPLTIPATTGSGAGIVTVGIPRTAAFLNGRIAHHRMWSAALTLDELTREMKSYLPVRRTSLILDAPYDDKTGRDYSGRSNHGTITEATQITGPPGLSYGGRVLLPRARRTATNRRATAAPLPVRAWYGL